MSERLSPKLTCCSSYCLIVLPIKVMGSVLSMCLKISFFYNKTFSSPILLKIRQKQITEFKTRDPISCDTYPSGMQPGWAVRVVKRALVMTNAGMLGWAAWVYGARYRSQAEAEV